MTDYNYLNHTMWDCKYHVVFIPKYRKKILFGQLRQKVEKMFIIARTLFEGRYTSSVPYYLLSRGGLNDRFRTFRGKWVSTPCPRPTSFLRTHAWLSVVTDR